MKVHPEMRQGETLMGNFTYRYFASSIALKTKRIGKQALYTDNEPITGMGIEKLYPVFASLKEIGSQSIVEQRTLERRND